jgi:hypothetical protein
MRFVSYRELLPSLTLVAIQSLFNKFKIFLYLTEYYFMKTYSVRFKVPSNENSKGITAIFPCRLILELGLDH